MKEVLKLYKENIYSIVLVSGIFIALFFTKLVPVFICTLFFLWIFRYKDFKRAKLKIKWVWPFLFYAFVFLGGYFFSENNTQSLKILERHISFAILPLLIYFKEWSIEELSFFAKLYVKLIVLIALISILSLIYFYSTNMDFIQTMDETYLQWKLPHLLGFHPTYFGFLLVVANILLLTKISSVSGVFRKIEFYIALFLSIYLLYLSPRTALFCLLIIWCWFGYDRFKNRSRIKIGKNRILIVIFFVILTTMLFFTSEYFIVKIMKIFTDKRFILWEPAFDVIRSNYYLLGEGLGNGETYLNKYILENRLTQFKGADLHNQYIMNYLDLGILGISATFLILLRPLKYIKDKGLTLFVIVMSISMFTESFLYVIKGIIIFIIMSSYFIIRASKTNDTQNV